MKDISKEAEKFTALVSDMLKRGYTPVEIVGLLEIMKLTLWDDIAHNKIKPDFPTTI